MNDESPAGLEPLARLARFAFDWAPSLCNPEHGCEAYHRGWTLMRLLDQDGASPAGWPFLTRELRRLPRGVDTRILLSGSADTGLAAIVASALGPDEATLVLTDRCETPLQQGLLFARHLRRAIETHRCDIRALDCAPVDTVIAHSFLINFAPEEQFRVVGRWAHLLKPGGVVLMSNRLAPEDRPPRQRTEDARIEARVPVVRARALELGFAESELDGIEAVARAFWRLPSAAPITESQMRDNLRHAGLELESLTYDDAAPVGPMTRRHEVGGHRRAEIVARKPG